MLRLIVRLAVSPITISVLLLLWGWELFWMIRRGSATNATGAAPQAGATAPNPFWDAHRTASFAWLTLILLSYFAHWFKKKSLGYYGLLEIIVGLVGGSFAVAELPMNQPATWLAMGGASYVVVRGAEHISNAISAESPIVAAQAEK
jgi:hypothetical protein